MEDTKAKGRLLIFCGIPGSGKTTIAHLVASGIGDVVHIQTDAFRFMIPAPQYTWGESRFVYEAMYLVARQALKSGYDAILDATFLRDDYRAEAARKLERYAASMLTVCVLCDLEVAKARNSGRQAAVPEASFNRLAASFEKPGVGVTVRSDEMSPEEAAFVVLRRVRRLPRGRASRGARGPATPRR